MFAYDAQPVLLKHTLKEKHHRDPKRSVPQLGTTDGPKERVWLIRM